jgi:hypothetical protein
LLSYGSNSGDTKLGYNAGSTSITLGFAFNWYGYTYSKTSTLIAVGASGTPNTNVGGLLVLTDSNSLTQMIVPYGIKNGYKRGYVFYRSTTQTADLSTINRYINQAYSTSATFSATAALVVTFFNMQDNNNAGGGYSNGKTNTFQAVLATDGTKNYIIFNYGTCYTQNGLAYVQNGASQYQNWDSSVYASYALDYNYVTYQGQSVSTQTNACNNGQFIYSYPVQTVVCASSSQLPWWAILLIVLACLIFVLLILTVTGLLGTIVSFVGVNTCKKNRKSNVAPINKNKPSEPLLNKSKQPKQYV